MADLQIYETGNGGDLILKGNDVSIIEGFQNMPYLDLFSGNPGHPTTGPKIPNEESFDHWGNFLLHPNTPELWWNSLTEHLLNNTAINSNGRIKIERAVKKDLRFMEEFAEIEVNVSLISVDKIKISIILTEPDNLNSNEFTYIWDATNNELSVGSITSAENGNGIMLDYILNYEL